MIQRSTHYKFNENVELLRDSETKEIMRTPEHQQINETNLIQFIAEFNAESNRLRLSRAPMDSEFHFDVTDTKTGKSERCAALLRDDPKIWAKELEAEIDHSEATEVLHGMNT